MSQQRFARFPEGFVELGEHDLTITGGDPMVIPYASVRSAVCREGKKSIFSRSPPAVLELEYASGLDSARVKLLLQPDARAPLAEALAARGVRSSRD